MPSPMLQFRDWFEAIQANIERSVRGKPEVVRLALTCLFARGHLLIEDVPGVAKTSLAKAMASSIHGGRFRRIQFTPDLLPSDLTGVEVFNPDSRLFEFREGPVFAHVLLGDEINRASPKTQSALLQVMAEGEVTIGLVTHRVPEPFFCVATQNPVEHQGTYMLPEAQLDRFLMRISVGYPGHVAETDIVARAVNGDPRERVEPMLPIDEIGRLTRVVRQVSVGDALRDYLVTITSATRADPAVRLGISPRGSIALAVAAQAVAASHGRAFATPDDVKAVAGPALEHRLLLTQDALVQGMTAEKVLQEVLDNVPVPRRP
jgi:MoxR-like ATPase